MPATQHAEHPVASGDVTEETYVVFEVDGRLYALPVALVQRALPLPVLTRLPTADPDVVGVFQHAGQVITTWDARRWFQAGNDPPAEPWLLVVEHKARLRAILVDRVVDVLRVPAARLVDTEPPRGVDHAMVLGRLAAPALDPDDDQDHEGTGGGSHPLEADGLDHEQAERQARRNAAESLERLGAVHVVDLDALLPGVAI